MNFALKHRITDHVPTSCQNLPTYDSLVIAYRELYLQEKLKELGPGADYDGFEIWMGQADHNEIMHEAYLNGYDEYKYDDSQDLCESKSVWKEDANEFRKLATKLGLLSDTLEDYDDADPAEYEEQQFDDWAEEIIRQISPYNR
jgi:hypothetical protein